MTDLSVQQQIDELRTTVSQLSGAVNTLVTQFLHPLTQQSVENQNTLSALIRRTDRLTDVVEQHQEWLDEDRHDLANQRQQQLEQARQIQMLLDESRADRISANERFDAFTQRFDVMQSEIRQNQRLLLENQQKLRENDRKLDATLSEVLALSRRVADVEDAA